MQVCVSGFLIKEKVYKSGEKTVFPMEGGGYGPAVPIIPQICDQRKVGFFKKWTKNPSVRSRMTINTSR